MLPRECLSKGQHQLRQTFSSPKQRVLTRWHALCEGRKVPGRGLWDYLPFAFHERIGIDEEIISMFGCAALSCGVGSRRGQGCKNWRPSLVVGNDGHLGDFASRRRLNGRRGNQRQGRRDGVQNSTGCRRSRFELAAVCREGKSSDCAKQGCRHLRMLDKREPQVLPSGICCQIYHRREPLWRRLALL